VVNFFPFPQGDENLIPIVAELNKCKWGEREIKAEAKAKG
jgi:hypothetical protein